MKNIVDFFDFFSFNKKDCLFMYYPYKTEIEEKFGYNVAADFSKILDGVPLNSIDENSLKKIYKFLSMKNDKNLSFFIKNYFDVYKSSDKDNYKYTYVLKKQKIKENIDFLIENLIKKQKYKNIEKKNKNCIIFNTTSGNKKILYKKNNKIHVENFKPQIHEKFMLDNLSVVNNELDYYELNLLKQLMINKTHVKALLKRNAFDWTKTLNDLIEFEPLLGFIVNKEGKEKTIKKLKNEIKNS